MIGTDRLVFDAKLWRGKDAGDNSQFFKPATIIALGRTEYGEQIATVRFHHDGRESRGHFTDVMQAIS